MKSSTAGCSPCGRNWVQADWTNYMDELWADGQWFKIGKGTRISHCWSDERAWNSEQQQLRIRTLMDTPVACIWIIWSPVIYPATERCYHDCLLFNFKLLSTLVYSKLQKATKMWSFRDYNENSKRTLARAGFNPNWSLVNCGKSTIVCSHLVFVLRNRITFISES